MLESVKDPVIDIRLAAVEALGNVAAKDNEAVLAALRGVSEEGQATLREAANTAIKKIQERP